MSPITTSRARRIVNRINAIWAELDYAQRRTLEIQTGVTGLSRRENPTTTRVHHSDSKSRQ